jgi:hypothetical protein
VAPQENGYVDMVVRYKSRPAFLTFLAESLNISLPHSPEYVSSALSGSILVVYDAFNVASAPGGGASPSIVRECSTDVMTLQTEGRAVAATWDTGEDSSVGAELFKFQTGLAEVPTHSNGPSLNHHAMARPID